MKKYVRFKAADGSIKFGRVDDNDVIVLNGCIFDNSLVDSGEVVKLDSITEFLVPIESPNIIAIGANYVNHVKECDAELPTVPLVFIKTTNSLLPHNGVIKLPKLYADEVDYEAELAVYIGKEASYVEEDEAMDYVLGYSCSNDISARDVQLRIDSQWARGKSFDTFAPIGPFLVTGVEDVESLHVKHYLNGKLVQDQPVSDMIFSIPRIISHLSKGITLLPGTVILTGTPAGVGMAQDPQRFLQDGDTAEVVIDKIGALRNTVSK